MASVVTPLPLTDSSPNQQSPLQPVEESLPRYTQDQPSKGDQNFARNSLQRKPLPPPSYDSGIPQPAVATMVHMNAPKSRQLHQSFSAEIETYSDETSESNPGQAPGQVQHETSSAPAPPAHSLPLRSNNPSPPNMLQRPQAAFISSTSTPGSPSPISEDAQSVHSRSSSGGSGDPPGRAPPNLPQLQYHHQQFHNANGARTPEHRVGFNSGSSGSPSSSNAGDAPQVPNRHLTPLGHVSKGSLARPLSSYSALSDMARGRTRSPQHVSGSHLRAPSAHSQTSHDSRPNSYINLLNGSYPQPAPQAANFNNNTHLRNSVGANASLLSHKQTLEMYRTNAKKTNDPQIQYEFAIFMVSAAQDAAAANGESLSSPKIGSTSPKPDAATANAATGTSPAQLLKEARGILIRLADRGYPFAQYFLADGYASGLFNKGKEDWGRAFPLFVSAGKHGHAESCYRAALCFEFGWGTSKDPAKAEGFYRQAATKSHPGAMLRLGKACLLGDMGLVNRRREGLKWLRRATDHADAQYNAAPYELGLLHEFGFYGDVFPDEVYAAQLYTQAAELGHPEAGWKMGDAYEHGKLGCPIDAGLSVHFYTGAANKGQPNAMMALCAWYLVGAEPVLMKDDGEAYEWALRAAECGLAKAQYAVGYFTESGIGTRPDPLEANVWYVRAADQGDERARHRLAAIRAAAEGATEAQGDVAKAKVAKGRMGKKKSIGGSEALAGAAGAVGLGKDDKDCVIM